LHVVNFINLLLVNNSKLAGLLLSSKLPCLKTFSTKDFVGYDVSRVQTPERINGMLLGEEEKSAFKRGELVELTDGTRVQHRASDPKGIRSDRKALVLSVLLDGGISYLLIRGIQSLRDGAIQVNHRSPAFNQALEEMQGAKNIHQQTPQSDINQYLGPKKITRH